MDVKLGSVDVVVGAQWGDEGKGRVVDDLVTAGGYSVVARYNGGPNAGHKISVNGGEALALHQVPSGVRNPEIMNIMGNGMLIDPVRLVGEIEAIRAAGLAVGIGNLAVSKNAHLILPHHVALDQLREQGASAQGSTRRGIAFAAAEKYQRSGLQAWALQQPDILEEHARVYLTHANRELVEAGLSTYDVELEIGRLLVCAAQIAPYVTNTMLVIKESLSRGERVLAEGAQSASLDIEQAPYPYGTSSHTTSGGATIGLSIAPQCIGTVTGVVKAIKSRVGDGPFVTEVHDPSLLAVLRGKRDEIDGEYGTSTGRERKLGVLDAAEIRAAVWVNGIGEIALTKLDCLSRYGSEIPVAIAYELDGRRLEVAPTIAAELDRCMPIYETLEGWPDDISGARTFDDLPAAAQRYVTRLEGLIGVPITRIGVGPHPHQMIRR